MPSPATIRALSLYKAIMRMHREKLPSGMRELGDVYLRKEFRTHMYSAKCSEPQFEKFIKGWDDYLQVLSSQLSSGSVKGQALSADELSRLNEDQNQKLISLEKEIKGV